MNPSSAGKTLVMEYLANHSGMMFTNTQLAQGVGMPRDTLTSVITKIRRDWLYSQYFRSTIRMRDDGVKVVYHYTRLWTREDLFESPKK